MSTCNDPIAISNLQGFDPNSVDKSNNSAIQISFDDTKVYNLTRTNINFLNDTPSNTTLTYQTDVNKHYTLLRISLNRAPQFRLLGDTNLYGEYTFTFSLPEGNNPRLILLVIPVENDPTNGKDVSSAKLRDIFPNDMSYIEYGGCNNPNYGNFRVIYFIKRLQIRANPKETIVVNNNIPFKDDVSAGRLNMAQWDKRFVYYASNANMIKKDTSPLRTSEFQCVDLNTKTDVDGDYVLVNPKTGERLEKILRDGNAEEQAAFGQGGIGKMLLNILIIMAVILGILLIYFIFRVSTDATFRDRFSLLNILFIMAALIGILVIYFIFRV